MARRWWSALRLGVPKVLLNFGDAPGDDLLCTAVFRELRKRGHGQLWMMSKHPALFAGNRDVARVVPPEDRYRDHAAAWRAQCHFLEYAPADRAQDTCVPPKRHIIAELCARVGITGEIVLRPYFHLAKPELAGAHWAKGAIAIQSSGLAATWPMRNKQWYPERFQETVAGLHKSHQLVQLGAKTDPPLEGVVDLRGKTSLRETAAVLANCRVYIGNVGFLMHLARAVECPSVVVYGGREAPWQSGYGANLNLFTELPCAPCWRLNTCDIDRACMKNITSQEVLRAVEEMLARPNRQLAEDRHFL